LNRFRAPSFQFLVGQREQETLGRIRKIINRALRRIGEHPAVRSDMQRLRLKADGRIVELRDGQEFPLAPEPPSSRVPAIAPVATTVIHQDGVTQPRIRDLGEPVVRDLRRRARLTQLEFAARLGVPVETIRNWEQGKRTPRGPARALLAVIAHAPDTVFAALATESSPV
jgi:putative transcriptional regulator